MSFSMSTSSATSDSPIMKEIYANPYYLHSSEDLSLQLTSVIFTVQQLSQLLDCLTQQHLQAAHQVLRYLNGTLGQGLFYPSQNSLHLKVFSYSDWTSCIDSRKSTTRFCVFLGDALISWKTKKQQTISRSSSKTEYRAMTTVTCEIQWLQYLLQDLQVPYKTASLYCDNQSAIRIA